MAERTFTTAIIPPKVKHINSINSMCFNDQKDLIIFTSLSNSILFDFFIKIMNKTNLTDELMDILPYKNNINWRNI